MPPLDVNVVNDAWDIATAVGSTVVAICAFIAAVEAVRTARRVASELRHSTQVAQFSPYAVERRATSGSDATTELQVTNFGPFPLFVSKSSTIDYAFHLEHYITIPPPLPKEDGRVECIIFKDGERKVLRLQPSPWASVRDLVSEPTLTNSLELRRKMEYWNGRAWKGA